MSEPLNPALYQALVDMFTNVGIESPGEKANIEVRSTKILGKPRTISKVQKHSGGEHYSICCPYCKDVHRHLWISYTWGASVKVNGLDTQLSKFTMCCYRRNCLNDPRNRMDLIGRISTQLKSGRYNTGGSLALSETTMEEQLNNTIALPAGMPLSDPRVDRRVIQYVTGRGDNPHEWHRVGKVQVSYIPVFGYDPALVFPITMHGVLKGWQARYGISPAPPEGMPKYYIPSGMKKSWLLYNFDIARMLKIVVLTEGITDVLRVGAPGVAMFGKKPSEYQLSLLVDNWREGALVWLPDMNDPQSVEIAGKLVTQWNNRRLFKHGAYTVHLNAPDAGSCPRGEIWNTIFQRTGIPVPSVCRTN